MQIFSSLRYALLIFGVLFGSICNAQPNSGREGIVIPPSPQPPSPQPPSPPPSGCAGVDCLIGGYGSQVRSLMLEMPVEAATVMDVWKIQTDFFKFPTPQLAINSSKDAVIALFKSPDSVTTAEDAKFNIFYSFDPSSAASCSSDKNLAKCSSALAGASPSDNINFNTFFGPLTYNDQQQQSAKNFLNMGTQKDMPVELIDIPGLLKKEKAVFGPTYDGNQALKAYLTALRLYATIQATAMGNLYQFYNERLPFGDNADPKTKNLLQALAKEDPNMPGGGDPKKISPLELDNYMATRRITDTKEKSWLSTLPDNNPATLLRQIAILQAETLAETHRLRVSIDRLTATTSMTMLQNTTMLRDQIKAQADKLKQG